MRLLPLMALTALTLSSCRLDVTGAPCSSDESCPTGQRCGPELKCVLADGAAGGGSVSTSGGGAGGGETGGGDSAGGASGGGSAELGDGGLTSMDAGADAGLDAGSVIGVGCTGDGECASGFCTDGVCCESRCLGACEACSRAGTCGTSDAGVQPLMGHGTCASEAVSTCGRDGTCDGLGNCARWRGVECAGPSCAPSGAVGPSMCDGFGQCNAPSSVGCAPFVCADGGCPASCTVGDDSLCQTGLGCVAGTCVVPSCTDGVVNGAETGIDCGGPAGASACARCGADAGCRGPLDCLSGTCEPALVCSVPTYVWNTTAFSACSAAACNAGTQTRTVTCLRSDNVVVADMFCTGSRPGLTQNCTNLTGCTWEISAFGACSMTCGSGTQSRAVRCRRPDTMTAPDSYCPAPKPATSQACFANSGCSWFIGGFGPCSVRCGSGSMMRTVYCRNPGGAVVPDSFCPTSKPTTNSGCSGPVCTVYMLGHPTAANGPCYSPTCTGPQPVAPACPGGYASTRYEEACGNPNICNGSWPLCTFLQQANYGCTGGAAFVTRVSVRQCTFQ